MDKNKIIPAGEALPYPISELPDEFEVSLSHSGYIRMSRDEIRKFVSEYESFKSCAIKAGYTVEEHRDEFKQESTASFYKREGWREQPTNTKDL